MFIPRRDTNFKFNRTLGGWVFPENFERIRFEPSETNSTVAIRTVRADGDTEISFAGHFAKQLTSGSIFPSLWNTDGFWSLGATGYSATHSDGHYYGMELALA